MSSTNRGSTRIENDVYATPEWAVHRLLDATATILPWGDWLEPCAGNGAIVRAVHSWTEKLNVASLARWTAVEIRPDAEADLRATGRCDHVHVADFLELVKTDVLFDAEDVMPVFPLTLTNPPFALAMEFVRACRQISEHTVMLLRLNFLGSEERSTFIRETTPDIYVLPDRCEFAMSVSCGGHLVVGSTRPSCGYKETLPFTVPRPKVCAKCGGRVKIVTADSVEYAWFHWHKNASGHYTMLASTPLEERKKDHTR